MQGGLFQLPWQLERERIWLAIQTTTMTLGAKYFVISAHWWASWKAYCVYDQMDCAFHAGAPRPSVIVNSHLLVRESVAAPGGSGGGMEIESRLTNRLRTDVTLGTDFVLLPEHAGHLLAEWYSCDVEIGRLVIQMGIQRQPVVELWPIKLILVKDPRAAAPVASTQLHKIYQPQSHIFSQSAGMKAVKLVASVAYNIAPHHMTLLVRDATGQTHDITNVSQSLAELGIAEDTTIVVRARDTFNVVGQLASTPLASRNTQPTQHL
eukprot:TRINITY_DN9400_c0_g2_i1.p1 TRINITY_DN9400_c0_g2~~TRINITY_DN9400_c0_g2_i1.p1  ORF type:complete len:301 (+),score=65.89 TRINITY_DN9400_c0_g2_i1:110-904(+)